MLQNIEEKISSFLELIKINYNEFIFIIYLFLFSYIKIVLVTFSSYSSLIMFAIIFLILIIQIKRNNYNFNIFLKFIFFFTYICLIFFTCYLFTNNNLLQNRFFDFFIYGLIPIFLLIKVKNIRALLLFYSFISITQGILMLFDPFFGYMISSDYMQYGFNYILPAIIGTLLAIIIFKRKFLLLLLLFLSFGIIFANKGIVITSLIISLISYIFYGNKRDKVTIIKKIIFLFVLLSLLLAFSMPILNFLIKFFDFFGISSYSLITIRELLSGGAEGIFETRLDIWINSLSYLDGHFLFGRGIAFLEGLKNDLTNYPHNIFVEILLSFGLVGFLFFFFFFVFSIYKLLKLQNADLKFFIILILLSWIIPLQFSLTFWQFTYFWVYIGFIIFNFCKEDNYESIN